MFAEKRKFIALKWSQIRGKIRGNRFFHLFPMCSMNSTELILKSRATYYKDNDKANRIKGLSHVIHRSAINVRMKNWVSGELEKSISIREAKAQLNSLLDDRKTIAEQLAHARRVSALTC